MRRSQLLNHHSRLEVFLILQPLSLKQSKRNILTLTEVAMLERVLIPHLTTSSSLNQQDGSKDLTFTSEDNQVLNNWQILGKKLIG